MICIYTKFTHSLPMHEANSTNKYQVNKQSSWDGQVDVEVLHAHSASTH